MHGLQKDTNCQSELKPVFIYTGIHILLLYLKKSPQTKKASAFMHHKAVQYDSLVIPVIRM